MKRRDGLRPQATMMMMNASKLIDLPIDKHWQAVCSELILLFYFIKYNAIIVSHKHVALALSKPQFDAIILTSNLHGDVLTFSQLVDVTAET